MANVGNTLKVIDGVDDESELTETFSHKLSDFSKSKQHNQKSLPQTSAYLKGVLFQNLIHSCEIYMFSMSVYFHFLVQPFPCLHSFEICMFSISEYIVYCYAFFKIVMMEYH
jgi:hypothetical protein